MFLELDTPLTRGTNVSAALVGVAKPGEPPVVPDGHTGVPLSSNSTSDVVMTETSKEDDDVDVSAAPTSSSAKPKEEEESASDWI